jgi:hypothetical protein
MGHKDNSIPETPEEIALAQVASERWQDYQKRFVPVENKAINYVENTNLGPMAAGMANLGTQEAFSQGEQQVTGNMESRGMRAGSPGFGMNLAGYNINRAESTGLGGANAYGLATTQKLGNLQNLVAMGQGQAGASLSGQSDVAGLASRQATIDAQASIAARGAMGEGIGTFAGMSYGNYTNNKPSVFDPNANKGP